MTDGADDDGMSRRTLLKVGAGGAVGVGAGGAAALYFMTQPAVAVEGLTAEDVHIDTVDGQVQELTIAPEITVAWSDYPAVDEVQLQFRADGPQNNGTVIEWTEAEPDEPAESGEVEFTFEPHHMLQHNDGPLDAQSFEPAEGEELTEEVTVMVDLRLVDDDGDTIEEELPIQEVTYAVTVTHAEGEVEVTGRLNTAGQCLDIDESLLDEARCRLTD